MKITEVTPEQVKSFVKTRLIAGNPHLVERFEKEELAVLVQATFFNEQELRVEYTEEKAVRNYVLRKEIAYQVIQALLGGSDAEPDGVIKDEKDWCRYFEIQEKGRR